MPISVVSEGIFINISLELSQAIDKPKVGTIDSKDQWNKNSILEMTTFTVGRWKFYYEAQIVSGVKLIKVDEA